MAADTPFEGELPAELPEGEVEEDFFVKAAAGYVEIPKGPTCGNCEYAKGRLCLLFNFLMDPVNGCCSYWEAAEKSKKYSRDWLEEAKDEAE